MKQLARVFLGLAGFGLLALAFMPMTENRAAASNPQLVTLANVPLPVQGTVTVGNTASVSVANTPGVNVSNSPTVSIGNTPTVTLGNAAVSVNNALDSGGKATPLLIAPQGQPYQDACTANSPQSACSLQSLPGNMRLVIQVVDMQVNLSSSDKMLIGGAIEVSVNGTYVEHPFLLAQQGADSTDSYWIVHQPTTLYNDPGTNPVCHVFSIFGPSKIYCQISGYLVPAQ